MIGGKLLAGGVAAIVLSACGDDVAISLVPETVDADSVAGESVGPRVLLAVPTEAARAEPDVVIKILFSMPMDIEASSSAFGVVDGDGAAVNGSLRWDVSSSVAAFRPDEELDDGAYAAHIDTSARSSSGLSLDEAFLLTFEVEASSGNDKPYAG